MSIFLEIFGYVGTALVLLSMMMTSVMKLRWLNIAGSVVSMTYAALSDAWPVVFLNFGLIIINSIQVIRHYKFRSLFTVVPSDIKDGSVRHLLRYYSKDIKQYFPKFDVDCCDDPEILLIYDGAEAVGILAGERQGDMMLVDLAYVSPKHRGNSVKKCIFDYLKDNGVKAISSIASVEKHKKHLLRMNFEEIGGMLVKNL